MFFVSCLLHDTVYFLIFSDGPECFGSGPWASVEGSLAVVPRVYVGLLPTLGRNFEKWNDIEPFRLSRPVQ